MRTAPNLAEWRTWCRQQGAKLNDGSVDIHSLFRSMIIPTDVSEVKSRVVDAPIAVKRPVAG